MAAKEDRKFILECLRLYKTLPALWNMKSQDYKNRIKKNEQYDQLLRKYRERYPNADRNQLVKKLNVLRTNYRKELKRMNNTLTSEADKVKPTLWYFDELKFLEELKAPCNSQNVIKIEVNDDIETEEDVESSHIVDTDRYTIVDCPPKKKLNKKENSLDIMIPLTNRRIQKPAQSRKSECERIALAWAVDLEKMRPLQQLFAKKAINDILFEGQMGTLHRDSVQINRNPLIMPSGESTPCSAVSPNPVTYE